MVNIPLGLGDWESASQDVPRLKLHNLYVVRNPNSADELSRVSRPTLDHRTTVGVGPIYTMWKQPNILGGDSLVVSGSQLFRLTSANVATSLGTMAGTDIPQIAGTQLIGLPDNILVARNGLLYLTDGVSMSLVAVPDGQLVSSVATINSYFLISIAGTQKFYWIEPGETTIDPINFASAERIPDPIISITVIGDEVWFLGGSGPEVWVATGDLDTPFQRVSGRVYLDGCHSKDTVSNVVIGGVPAALWVTDTKVVVRGQGVPTKISTEAVDELLKQEDDLSSWSFRHNRSDFYLISSPSFTLSYDIANNLWARWDTYNLPYWVAQSGVQHGSEVVAGNAYTNELYTLTEGVSDVGLPVIREVAGFLPNSAKPVKCGEVVVYVNAGWSPTYGLNPMLELRWSDDLGATWSDYVATSMGAKGQYSRTVSYRSLGLIKQPGRVFEFRMADFVRFRIDYATMNERQ